MNRFTFTLHAALAAFAIFISGCSEKAISSSELPPPQVTVDVATPQDVTDYLLFTGRAEPKEEVEVRSRVSGQLLKITFEPGTEITEGTALFEIDPAPFLAEVAMAEAKQTQAQAAADRATRDFARIEQLKKSNASSDAEFDQALSAKQETAAALQVADAQVKLAQLNRDYTQIASPISGRVGDRLLSEGNYISGGTSNSPALVTVVMLDPIVVTFEIDESTLQQLQRATNDGLIVVSKVGEIPVSAGLAIDGGEYPLQGFVNFFDNRIDQNTGTLRVKAEFPNPLRDAGGRLVAPGMFLRVRLAIGKPHRAMLVPESALGSDQGTRYLMTVDEKNQADRLNVSLGGTFGSMVEIKGAARVKETSERPLAEDERIIVRGLQRVRPGMVVDPQELSTTR